MPHDTSLIVTIAAGVGLAFLLGLLASRFRLPPLLGYLMAGLAVGPFTPGPVADGDVARQLSEIGVTLLMFGVGLHFSIRDLLAVRRVAIPGALAQICAATLLGVGAGRLWGMGIQESLLFGLCLSVASTVVLLRALESRNELDAADGRIAVGWLVVEDIVIVLALVVLPLLPGAVGGVQRDAEGPGIALTLVLTVIKVVAFVGLMFILGKGLLPRMLGYVVRSGPREMFTVGIMAIALGIAFGAAELFSISPALGAFIAGVVIAESDLSHQVSAEIRPLQSTFTVLFFVSVGMLFDPSVLVQHPLPLLASLAIVLLGKSIVAAFIVRWLRYPMTAALTISASLAQIGELSFILASLGFSLQIVSSEALSVVLAVGVLSIALNPLMFAAVDALTRRYQVGAVLEADSAAADPVSLAPPTPSEAALRDHVVMVGHGRVGSVVGAALERGGVPYVVVDSDREVVEREVRRGIPAIFGDAALPGTLHQARLSEAKLLVVAIPANVQARAVVAAAKSLRPELPICVRTHHATDVEFFQAQRIERVVLGEFETALQMAEYALANALDGAGDPSGIIGRLREEGPAATTNHGV